jgi:chromosome segregation ATPase
MAYRANQQLREDIWDFRYNSSPSSLPDEDEKIVSFARQPAKIHSPTALNLVQQAAELFEGMENQARETEARAQSLCKSAAQRLRVAEKQRDAAERAHHDVVNELSGKLEDVTQALARAQKRIVAAEDHALAAEFRAQSAEAQLHKANRELAAIEEMIRKRLL